MKVDRVYADFFDLGKSAPQKPSRNLRFSFAELQPAHKYRELEKVAA